jgi:uncharacterized membrane protein YfcA
MNGFSTLMLIFGICLLLVGLYMFTGHELKAISWKAAFKNVNKQGWVNIGKWTMISSSVPFVLAIIGLFLDI